MEINQDELFAKILDSATTDTRTRVESYEKILSFTRPLDADEAHVRVPSSSQAELLSC